MKKHPLEIAWDEWRASNPKSFAANTLGTKEPDKYLGSRLAAAFNAGASAQRQIYLKALASADVLVETGHS